MKEYIRALKIMYRKDLPALEDFFNSVPDCGLTFNELIVQNHFSYLADQGKLTAKNMFYKLPEEYHWVAKRFLINKTKRVSFNWKKAMINLKLSLFLNKHTDADLLEYQQLHAPVRSTTIGTCG